MTAFNKDELKPIRKVSLFSLLRYAFLFRSNPLEAIARLARQQGDLFKIGVLGQELFFINNPAYIRHVLQDNYLNYPRAHTLEPFRELIGNGLSRADDDLWKKMFATLSPAFHEKQVETHFTGVVDETLDYFDTHLEPGEANTVVNIEFEMKRLSLRIASKIMLSPQLEIHTDPVIDAIDDIMQSADLRNHTRNKIRVAVSRKIPFGRSRSKIVTEAFEYLNGLGQQIIEEFFNASSEKSMFLTLLYNAYHRGEITIDQALDEIKTLLFAGYNTVAEALTWTLYSIDKVSGLRKQLEAEVDRVIPDGNLTMEKVSELTVLGRTIKESMRLYPPVWSLHRVALREDVIDRYYIPRNAWIMMSPYTLHRNEKYWDQPEKFDPDRFKNEDNVFPERYDYISFGQGPHMCIGHQMATFEMKTILALLLKRYRIAFKLKTKPVFRSTAILQSKNLILNVVSRRNGEN